MLLLGGSEGGDSMARAAEIFEQHGYVAASVAYFRGQDLPAALENVPVEIVGQAVDAIAARPDVAAGRIGIFGISKGGELALLAATLYPTIHAVVADSPSPFAWQGIARAGQAPASSWTFGGQPVPFVPYAQDVGGAFVAALREDKALELRPLYDASMKDQAAVDRAFFHLEQVHGPILILAGDDDRLWDSPAQGELAATYLREHAHPYADAYVHYPDAGHLFLFATPQQPLVEAPYGSDLTIAFGGTAKGNVAAASAAWTKIYAFLSEALR